MKVCVRFFAGIRQAVGQETIDIELPDQATVAELRDRLASQLPSLASLLRHATFAIGAEYVPLDATLRPNADVACIPPVSGG